MSDEVPVKRTVRGRRPQFFSDPAVDKLHGMMMAMATEMAVLYERIDTLERVAAAKGVMLAEELARFAPDESVQAAREAWRQRFLERLFYLYREELDDRLAGEDERQYARFLAEVAARERA
jgi:hypothetical protein